MNRPLVAVNGIKCVYRFRERKKKKKKKQIFIGSFVSEKLAAIFIVE